MSPGGEDGTSSAVPADLRAYSRAALEIDEQIHQLALRLGRVLDAYRATNPEFGDPIPRIEDDLARYAQFCRDVDLRVGRIADAFEHAGALPSGVAGPPAPSSQPVVVSEALLAQAVQATIAPPPPPPKAKPKDEHHGGGGLFGGLLHAVEHPVDTLGDMASGAGHLASDAVGAVGDAGSALVHAIEHPSEDLAAAATGLERAAGGVRDFAGYVADEATKAEKRQLDVVGDVVSAVGHPADTAQAVEAGLDRLGDRALVGLEALGGRMLHDIEHPIDGLKDVAHAQEEFLSGFASGVKDMAQAALLLSRVIPGTPMWAASMAIDPVGTMKLQEQFAKGLVHMAADPGEALGNMIDIKDLEAGNFARWEGHITPDVIVTLLTAGAGGAAAGAGEGIAASAAETTAEQAAKTVAEGAAESVAEGAGGSVAGEAQMEASEAGALEAEAAAARRLAEESPRIDEGLRGAPLSDAEQAEVGIALARAREILAAAGKETSTEEALMVSRKMVGELGEQARAALGDLREVARSQGGEMIADSEKYMVKSVESLARKLGLKVSQDGLTLEEAQSEIGDAVRFTMTFSERGYGRGVAAALDELRARGYSIAERDVENSWIKGQAYKGININAYTPGGQIFELQFHTPESLAVKEANHLLYEAKRLETTSEADKAMMVRAGRLSSESLDHPPGIADIGVPKIRR